MSNSCSLRWMVWMERELRRSWRHLATTGRSRHRLSCANSVTDIILLWKKWRTDNDAKNRTLSNGTLSLAKILQKPYPLKSYITSGTYFVTIIWKRLQYCKQVFHFDSIPSCTAGTIIASRSPAPADRASHWALGRQYTPPVANFHRCAIVTART